MPDNRRFILREKKTGGKEFAIYASQGQQDRNWVKLQRGGFHEASLCIKREDAVKIWKRDIDTVEGLQVQVLDDTRVSAGMPECRVKLWPILPYKIIPIDDTIVEARFRVALSSYNVVRDLDYPQHSWDQMQWAENSYDHQAVVNNEPTSYNTILAEYQVNQNIDCTNREFGGLSVASTVDDAILEHTAVGIHNYRRASSQLQWLHTLAAVTGTVWWVGTGDGYIYLDLANATQPDLDTFRPDGYVVKDYPNIESSWVIPYIARNGFFHRQTVTSTTFGSAPSRTLTGAWTSSVTIPTLYLPTTINAQTHRSFAHYSSLVLPSLVMTSLPYGSISVAQQWIDAQANTWERCVKAAERTVAGYVRASRRSDWYMMAGYHDVSLGAEIAQVEYVKGRTYVRFHDSRLPKWPMIPTAASPGISFVKVSITSKISAGLYHGTVIAPHSGPWSAVVWANALGQYGTTIHVEDSTGLYPWLDVGDTVLAVYDGVRGVVINTLQAADVELQ